MHNHDVAVMETCNFAEAHKNTQKLKGFWGVAIPLCWLFNHTLASKNVALPSILLTGLQIKYRTYICHGMMHCIFSIADNTRWSNWSVGSKSRASRSERCQASAAITESNGSWSWGGTRSTSQGKWPQSVKKFAAKNRFYILCYI